MCTDVCRADRGSCKPLAPQQVVHGYFTKGKPLCPIFCCTHSVGSVYRLQMEPENQILSDLRIKESWAPAPLLDALSLVLSGV